MKYVHFLSISLLLIIQVHKLFAQAPTNVIDPIKIANEYIIDNLAIWGLTPQDLDGMTMTDMYTDKSTGITRIYFQQHHQGIPVFNAILNLNITKEGTVFFAGNRFVPGLSDKVNTSIPALQAHEAVNNLVDHLGLSRNVLRMKQQQSSSKYIFEKAGIANDDITAELTYYPFEENVKLTWDILLAPVDSDDNWNSHVDAITGKVMNKYNWTMHCDLDPSFYSRESDHCRDYPSPSPSTVETVNTGAQYNVWPAPIESPNHGPRTMVINPFDTIGSPFGWHDINGHPGPEFTITRGNNAYVYQDRDDLGYSSGDEPDGGPDLHFDFPYDPTREPEEYIEACVVNLFYWINYMHDFAYHFGFDEEAGNFQQNNYGKGGAGNDFLYGVVQNGANVGAANNASYHYTTEGESGSIRMLVFESKDKFLQVNAPELVTGKYETSFPAPGWGDGAYVTTTPLTGEVVIADDGVESPITSDACEDIINTSSLAGKIAFIDRGSCSFGFKALQAQNAGAIAVIICNYNDDPYSMLPGPEGPFINIPVILIDASDGTVLRQYAISGLQVTLMDPGQNGPTTKGSEMDNGIIAHEFSHGISCRLIGGPDKLCIENAEQMGEGWSDFLALAITTKPGDTGEMKRGFATFALGEPITGKGYRRYPYSTNLNINPVTYGDVAPNQEEHDLGHVWASMLWDLYWAFVDRYGWSPDLYEPSSGNHKTFRLVFDGLKNTICNPGFVDGRDAILAADQALYNGENNCMIWEVFARRGLGYSADQGSSFDAGDQREAFDMPPHCTNKILIEKSVTPLIQPGEEIEVNIKVRNYKKETVTNVVITDEIPEGTIYKSFAPSLPGTVEGKTVLFALGNMNYEDEMTITYYLETDPNTWSHRKFLDEVSEETRSNWNTYTIAYEQSNDWHMTDQYPAHSGNFIWTSKEIGEKSRKALELDPGAYTFHVDGDRPALRFYHRYQTKAGLNGGVVDIREVGGIAWKQVENNMLRHGYTGLLNYETLASPNIHAFSGNSGEDYRDTYVDLTDWMGKDIQIRFRFGTNIGTYNGIGWLIDDIEFMDLLSYNGEACVTSDQGDYECAIAPESGTIVDSREDPLSSNDVIQELPLSIYPNPATDLIHITWPGENAFHGNIALRSMDGKEIFTKTFSAEDRHSLTLSSAHIPSGIYIVDARTTSGRFVGKVIVQK